MNATILYYTSNREDPVFEQRIRENILKVTDLPIISISQKPIDFGNKNIVVGEVGASGFNMFRQVLIGCEAADTEFIISAEADCIYPPDYFTWKPEKNNVCYRNRNLYVLPQHRTFFFKKEEGATHAQVVGRQFYIDTLKKLFEGEPMWSVEQKNFPKEKSRGHKDDVFHKNQIEYYDTENPVVQIKTSQSMRHYTNSDRIPRDTLPYWGSGKDFRKTYYDIGRRH